VVRVQADLEVPVVVLHLWGANATVFFSFNPSNPFFQQWFKPKIPIWVTFGGSLPCSLNFADVSFEVKLQYLRAKNELLESVLKRYKNNIKMYFKIVRQSSSVGQTELCPAENVRRRPFQ
jgi:hypothetical protein